MTSLLIFLAVCAGIVLVAWIVTKVNGAHAWMLEDWDFNDGETVLWRDDSADVGMIPRAVQAVVTRPVRVHRWCVVVTNQRIIMGNKTLRSGKHMVKYVLYPGAAPGGDSKRLDGGLFKTGYETLVIQPGVEMPNQDQRQPYVALQPAPDETSSVNLAEVRIYTDLIESFRLP
jgi:hypothetical protein